MTTFYDLSVPTEDSPSEPLPVKIEHEDHVHSIPMMQMFLGGNKEDYMDGVGWANDNCNLGTHAGTHVDAPWHYSPTSEGKPSRTIDQMPLDWFFHDGVVLDMRWKEPASGVTVDDCKKVLSQIKYTLKPWDIVMIQTGADKLWGKAEYFNAGVGMTYDSTLWLIDQGCRVMGIDAWGWDRPFFKIKEEFEKTHDKSLLWTAHKAGIKKEYCHIEKLANLDTLPRPFGFKVACFPVKITGASAGWTRVVAIVD